MKRLFLLIVLGLSLCACKSSETDNISDNISKIQNTRWYCSKHNTYFIFTEAHFVYVRNGGSTLIRGEICPKEEYKTALAELDVPKEHKYVILLSKGYSKEKNYRAIEVYDNLLVCHDRLSESYDEIYVFEKMK